LGILLCQSDGAGQGPPADWLVANGRARAQFRLNAGETFVISGTIAHYRILEKLGAGGMGEVYLAEDPRLGRKLAIKVLPVEFTQDVSRIARFEQEARAASALNHPNIITVYEIGREAGLHFIAFEYVAGRTLRHCLSSTGLGVKESLEITVQVAAALQAAHEAGITHRDIKPENVMLRPDGIVKVLDFGLAKLTEKSTDALDAVDTEAATKLKARTDPGTVMGTVTYMSPEQARGHAVDARSDIFSLGVLLYEMLTGRVPFDGDTTSDVIAAILKSEPPPLSRCAARIPSELDWSVSKALRKGPDERYQTVKGFLGDLRHLKQRLDFETELARIGHADLPSCASGEISEARTVEFRSDPSRILSSQSGGASRQIDSLAILPLSNAAGDVEMEYLSDGITESIINSLSQLPQLRVVPRSTVFRYKGREVDPQLAGGELNVRAVLTGRVLHVGDSLVVKTELVDVARASQLWGEQYRRRMTDIFELQEEISREISAQLRLQLTGEEKEKLVKRYTDNTEAYHLYLKGRHYVQKRVPDWIKKGIEQFQQAIDLDPNYALAHAGLAEAYGFLASSTGGQPPREAYPKAKAAAMKALELDDSLCEANCTLGFYYLLYDWDFAAAEAAFQRAIELNPNFANAWDGYGFYLKATGRPDEAIRACQRAQELEPLSLFMTLSLGWAYYFARQWDLALEQGRKVLEMDPNFGFAYWHRGMVQLQQRKFADAIASFRKAINLSGTNPTFLAYLGHALGRAGKAREARQMLGQLDALRKQQYVSSYYYAMVHLGLGDRETTLAWLDKASDERAGFLAFVYVEPMLDQLAAPLSQGQRNQPGGGVSWEEFKARLHESKRAISP
jgi:serine/threonine-protein kinase